MSRVSARRCAPTCRGVFVSEFRKNGYRWVYSIDSRNEQVTLRTVLDNDVDLQRAADDLWMELDRLNPLPPSDVSRPLRLAQ